MNIMKTKMSSRDRVFTALKRQIPDMVPILEWTIDERVIKKIDNSLTYEDFVEQYDLDAVCARENQQLVKLDDLHLQDEWGVINRASEAVLMPVKCAIEKPEDLKKLKVPDVHADHRQKAFVFVMRAVFMNSTHLRGMDNFFVDIYERPGFVEDLLDIVSDYNFKLGVRAIEEGAEIITFGDDYAGSQNLLMSPDHFERFIFPRLKKFVDNYKEMNVFCVKHSDGNIRPILDALIDLGFHALNPFEPLAGFDIGEVKKTYGDKVCIIGNIDCAHLLTNKLPEDVETEVKRCINLDAPGGGYILSSSNTIHSSVRAENFLAMINACRRYGKYPLNF